MDNYLLRLSLALCVAPAQNNDSADAAHSWSKQRLSKTTPSRVENTNCVFSLPRGEGLLCAAPCYATPSAPTATLARCTPLFLLSLAIFPVLRWIFLGFSAADCADLRATVLRTARLRPRRMTLVSVAAGSAASSASGSTTGSFFGFCSTLANNAATTTHSL